MFFHAAKNWKKNKKKLGRFKQITCLFAFLSFFFGILRDELYQLLEVDRRATPVEIKRAYRNKSLEMHPDKLNQRGQEVTEQDRAKFQKMKGAYDVSFIWFQYLFLGVLSEFLAVLVIGS